MTTRPTLAAGPEPGAEVPGALPQAVLRELCQALREIRYGAVELVIHDGRVVQLERREKVRFETGLSEHRR